MPLKPGSPSSAPGRGHEVSHFKTPYQLQMLTERGWEREAWVHCPLCRARSDGFDSKGRPRYTGGFLICRTEKHPRGVAVACECWLGRRKQEAQNLLRYDQLRESDRVQLFPQPPGRSTRVVDARGTVCTRGPAEEPTTLAPAYQGKAPERDEPPADLFGA